MDDEQEARFWLALIRTVSAALCVLIATFAGCNASNSMYQDRMISEDIAHGSDPMEARCAHTGESTECAIVAARPRS